MRRLRDGHFEIPGLNVEKLHGKSKLFSARLNREMRLIFSMKNQEGSLSIFIHELNHHDQAYLRAERSQMREENLEIVEAAGDSQISKDSKPMPMMTK